MGCVWKAFTAPDGRRKNWGWADACDDFREMGSTRASRAVRGTVWYVFSAFNECLPLPARNERGEGRVLASLSNAVSSPWPSPSSGQERGEENSAQGYNLSNAINGHSIAPERFILQPCFQKESEINDPGPARLFTFLDVHEQGIIDSTFGILPPGWNSPSSRADSR